MAKPIPGVIHGTTIELKENPGFADGEEVEVVLLYRRQIAGSDPGVSFERRTSAGMLAHLPPEVDEELDAIILERKNSVFREIPE